jgi:hypothetical protein
MTMLYKFVPEWEQNVAARHGVLLDLKTIDDFSLANLAYKITK